MGHLVFTVFIYHIIDYPLTTFIIKVGIDIGHGLTIGIKETLKQEVILDRVNIGDADTIGYCRSGGRSTTRTNKYAYITTGFNKVGYDKEVAGKTHGTNGKQLEVDPLFNIRGNLLVALMGPFPGQVQQVCILVIIELFRHFKVRQQDIPLQLQGFNLVYDHLRVINRLRQI
ncbi:hypothetical protein D3C72_887820 [compost metagenome]